MNGTPFLDIVKPLLNIAALNRQTVLHQRIYLFVAVQNHGMPLVSLNPVQNRPVAGKHVAEKPFFDNAVIKNILHPDTGNFHCSVRIIYQRIRNKTLKPGRVQPNIGQNP